MDGSLKIISVYINQGFLLKSVEKYLTSEGAELISLKADLKTLGHADPQADAVILFADGDISAWRDALVFIKDKAVDDDIPFFIIQGDIDIDDVFRVIPDTAVTETFRRPVNVREASSQILDYIQQHGKKSKKKILVVDDSGAMLRNVKAWLGDKYHVVLANSGAMAIKYMSMDRPDLVLLDYEMPVVNGKQVLEMIRTENDFSDIPVIFLTGKNDRESIMEVLALKPEGYLLKTMKPAEIITAVDDFFEKADAEEKIKKNLM
ncbi:MAG: response regulator [Lachnospiraceae bacterium]|nr:response regulator [Lachnospiraceae bacterium]